jgi:hypothetical protein
LLFKKKSNDLDQGQRSKIFAHILLLTMPEHLKAKKNPTKAFYSLYVYATIAYQHKPSTSLSTKLKMDRTDLIPKVSSQKGTQNDDGRMAKVARG